MADQIDFTDHAQVHEYADRHGLDLAWEGTALFAKRRRYLTPDQYAMHPVKTRRGVTMVMLYSKGIHQAEIEARVRCQLFLTGPRGRSGARAQHCVNASEGRPQPLPLPGPFQGRVLNASAAAWLAASSGGATS